MLPGVFPGAVGIRVWPGVSLYPSSRVPPCLGSLVVPCPSFPIAHPSVPTLSMCCDLAPPESFSFFANHSPTPRPGWGNFWEPQKQSFESLSHTLEITQKATGPILGHESRGKQSGCTVWIGDCDRFPLPACRSHLCRWAVGTASRRQR